MLTLCPTAVVFLSGSGKMAAMRVSSCVSVCCGSVRVVPKRGFDHTDLSPYCCAAGVCLGNPDGPPIDVLMSCVSSVCGVVGVDAVASEGATGPHDGTVFGAVEVSSH